MNRRFEISDDEWERLAPLLPSTRPKRGGRCRDHRQVLNGILFRVRTGIPWHDLPRRYGPVTYRHADHPASSIRAEGAMRPSVSHQWLPITERISGRDDVSLHTNSAAYSDAVSEYAALGRD